MKTKKIITKVMIGLCAVSLVALLIVVFTGCSTLDSASKNLNEYTIEVDYNSSMQTLTCSENISYINTSDLVLNYVAFHLYPNAFREESISPPVSLANYHKAYPNEVSYGDIEITSVSVLNSTATYCDTIYYVQPTYSEMNNFLKDNDLPGPQYFVGGEDENILYVLLDSELYPDDRIEISITFKVKLPNINHRFGYGENTVNIANFYPVACIFENGEFETSLYHLNGDPFYSSMANYTIILKVPASFIVSSTGYVVGEDNITVEEVALIQNTDDENDEEENEGEELQNITVEKRKLTMKARAVRDFAIVISEEFKVLSQNVDGTEIKYYYFSDENPSLSLETSVKALTTFNELIGKYPYSTLSVVEANFLHGGMEYPNLVYISNQVANKPSYQQVIVHEIAHQWWYNLVGSNASEYSWMDEGLTEYTTALFYELHPEYEVPKDRIITNAYNSFSLFLEVHKRVYGSVDTSMNRKLSEYKTEQEYLHITYVKGMLLFDSLREIMGFDKFVKCMQNYFSKYAFSNVTPAEMISSFEKTSGRNLETYFNAWINGDIILLK